MLTDLTTQNFKCYSKLHLKLAPLTLLTGFNGGGKSTSIQPLLLLAQTVRRDSNHVGLPLNGPLTKLGTAGDVVSPKGNPVFEISSDADKVTWTLAPRIGERTFFIVSAEAAGPLGQSIRWEKTVWPLKLAESPKQPKSTTNSIQAALSTLAYITAVRSGTPEVFPFPETDNMIIGDVGSDGQYAAYWYDRMVDEAVSPKRRHPTEIAETLRKQLDAYLSSLFPTAQANVTSIPQASALALRFRIGSSSEWRRPANTGFGLTYAFPILVALLTTPPDRILIIDSPEAHLHPSVQSEMGRILARAASGGVQIVVETHSDHLLNGVRLAVKEGLIAHDQVAIHFFGGASADTHGVTSPRIDAAGNINDWPTGFFDQTEKDLALLSGWTLRNMRWFVNDASIQGQFNSVSEFEPALRELLELRKVEPAYSSLFVTRAFGNRPVLTDQSLSQAVQRLPDRDIRVRVLQWINQRGPFLDDDRTVEANDYFECLGIDVTDQGLGEAARRIANAFAAGTWSFVGGATNFASSPLHVAHGIEGDRYGAYEIPNVWNSEAFRALALASLPEPKSWAELTQILRIRFPLLLLPDSFYTNHNLQAEPYEASIGDRVQELCRHLNEYMLARSENGHDNERTNEMIRTLFSNAAGAVPLFSGESSSNQNEFRNEMTFIDPEIQGRIIFAHWHGKIKHRFFRMHFEWPVPRESKMLKVLYLGPKLTKT